MSLFIRTLLMLAASGLSTAIFKLEYANAPAAVGDSSTISATAPTSTSQPITSAPAAAVTPSSTPICAASTIACTNLPVSTASGPTAVCVCSGSTFAQSLCSGTGMDILPCGYTGMPASALTEPMSTDMAAMAPPPITSGAATSATTAAASSIAVSSLTTLVTSAVPGSTTLGSADAAGGYAMTTPQCATSFISCTNLPVSSLGTATAVCVCSSSTFTQSLCLGTSADVSPCAYTVMPTTGALVGSSYQTDAAALSSPPPPSGAVAGVTASASSSAAPTAASSTTLFTITSNSVTDVASSATALPSSSDAVSGIYVRANEASDAPSSLPGCTDWEAGAEDSMGNSAFFVYSAQWNNKGCPDCVAEGITNVGMVHHSVANCRWFTAAAPAGYHQFTGPNLNQWVTPLLPFEQLTINNPNSYCNLQDITFQKKCDGSYMAVSANQGGRAKCTPGCIWSLIDGYPETGMHTQTCKDPDPGVVATCLMRCVGDFCKSKSPSNWKKRAASIAAGNSLPVANVPADDTTSLGIREVSSPSLVTKLPRGRRSRSSTFVG